MKNKISILRFLLFTIGLCLVSHAVKAADGDIESEDTVFILNKIDRIKKVLTLADAKIAYNTSTIFIDSNGNKKSIKDLVIGQVVSYQYDYKARYYSMPMATRIIIVL